MITPFQEHLIRVFFAMPESSQFLLAGGAALVVQRLVDRGTRDLDFFGPQGEHVESVAAAYIAALGAEGIEAAIARSSPTFVRMTVVAPDGQPTEVDIALDAPSGAPIVTDLGRLRAPEELAADKLLALFGRAEARDFVDVHALGQRFGMSAMWAWAKDKDRGLDPYVMALMLDLMDRHERRQFEVDDETYEAMRVFFAELRADLMRQAIGE